MNKDIQYKDLNDILEKYKGTCSINNLKENHVTFARNYEYTKKCVDIYFNLCIILPNKISHRDYSHLHETIELIFVDDVDLSFTIIHNAYVKRDGILYNIHISDHAKIHQSAILDAEGLKVAISNNNQKIQFTHTGGVKIEDHVEIGPYTVVHRASIDMTIIKKGVKIGAHCNIGHNNIIGKNTIFAAGVMTSGSVKIGENCWLGTGCVVRNGINICDDVVIGIGSVVVKDITKPGIYAGNPCKFLKEKSDNWNF